MEVTALIFKSIGQLIKWPCFVLIAAIISSLIIALSPLFIILGMTYLLKKKAPQNDQKSEKMPLKDFARFSPQIRDLLGFKN